ncbi:hypothetical protein J9100_002471 [Vibrio vulnificus]|nr:hypothetical protein [Vibrio vulnificus]
MKRFVIASKDKLDNGFSGFCLFFTEKKEDLVMGPNSSAKILVNTEVTRDQELVLRKKISSLGLKTQKWFSANETVVSVQHVKRKLGFGFLGQIKNRLSRVKS